MNAATLVLVIMAVGTFALKSAGPVVLGNRALPVGLQRVVDVLPAALLAALALVSTLGDGRSLTVDARLAGLIVAGLALWRRAPFVVAIVAAAAATAALRALTTM